MSAWGRCAPSRRSRAAASSPRRSASWRRSPSSPRSGSRSAARWTCGGPSATGAASRSGRPWELPSSARSSSAASPSASSLRRARSDWPKPWSRPGSPSRLSTAREERARPPDHDRRRQEGPDPPDRGGRAPARELYGHDRRRAAAALAVPARRRDPQVGRRRRGPSPGRKGRTGDGNIVRVKISHFYL